MAKGGRPSGAGDDGGAASEGDLFDERGLAWLERLVEIAVRSDLSGLAVESGGRRVEVRRERPVVVAAPAAAPAPAGAPAPAAPGPAPAPAPGSGGAAGKGGASEGTAELRSPMVGTLYRAPAPDAAVFVEVGDRVAEDTTVCIIEAMKVMNEIKAEMEGVVVEVLVQNGEAVEYGQPLFRIKRAR